MKKFVLFLIFFLISSHFSQVFAQTQDYFTQTRLSTLYDQTGESQSTLKITLRNLSSQNYPASLNVFIHGDKIDLISAKDDYGDLNYVYTYQPTGINSINVKFNRRMVGKDVLTHLNLIYKNPRAERSENTWVIFFPKISIDSPGDYQYQLTIPKSFGRLIAAENLPVVKSKSVDADLYTLSGNSLSVSSRMIFGDSYPFKFTLSYPDSTRIILPKDTDTQKIYITGISPEPQELSLLDNNWIAKFPNNQKTIVTGYAVFFKSDDVLDISKVSGFPEPVIQELFPHPYQYLPAKTINVSLTSPQYFWPFIDNTLTLHLKNPNFQALYNVTLDLKVHGMTVSSNTRPSISAIPPAGSINLPIQLKLGILSIFSPKSLEISTQNLQFSYNPNRTSLIFYYSIFSAFISLILILTLYFAWKSWRLFFQKRR